MYVQREELSVDCSSNADHADGMALMGDRCLTEVQTKVSNKESEIKPCDMKVGLKKLKRDRQWLTKFSEAKH